MNALPDHAPEQTTSGGRGDLESASRSWDLSSDAALADILQSDGIARVRSGQLLDLAEYIRLIPNLRAMPESLDAAISVTLASLAAGARLASESPSPAERLASRHPELRTQILEAEALNRVAAAARAFETMTEDDDAGLPRDFGPITEEGTPRYRLLEFLGAGAFGRVYLANDLGLADESSPALVALKVLDSGAAHEGEEGVAEAKSARRVDHANVVRVLDRGVSPRGERYIVFEYVAGGSLADALRSQPPPWTPSRAARIIADVARGLQAVHSGGLLHCDLKPGNILLTPGGTPRITDFGVAIRNDQLVRSRFGFSDPGVFGNLAFVSPEQFHGSVPELGPPSDVYALGGILFLLLSGELPNGSTRAEIERNMQAPLAGRQPPRLRWPRRRDHDLEAICTRALAPRPSDRYASAGEFASDLETWLSGHALAWNRPSLWRSIRLAARRNPLAAWALVALLTSVIAGSSFTTLLFFKHLRDHEVVHAADASEPARQAREQRVQRAVAGFFTQPPATASTIDPALEPLRGKLPADFLRSEAVRALLASPQGRATAGVLAHRTSDQLLMLGMGAREPTPAECRSLAADWAAALGDWQPTELSLLAVLSEANRPTPAGRPVRTSETTALLASLREAEKELASSDPGCLLRLLTLVAITRLEPGAGEEPESARTRLDELVTRLIEVPDRDLPPQ